MATDVERVVSALTSKGDGSLLRGWRLALDPNGSFAVSFLEFCTAAKNLNITVDAPRLFGAVTPDTLSLEELAPTTGKCVSRFKEWMAREFGGPVEMFMLFEPPEGDGKLVRQTFTARCKEHGFEARDKDLGEIFNLLDVGSEGFVTVEDLAFLENEKCRREGAVRKARQKANREYQKILSEIYRGQTCRSSSPTDRLAQRSWQASWFERLPTLVLERRNEAHKSAFVRMRRARAQFMRHIREDYGNGVRAWRRSLDPGGTFQLTRAELGRYCRGVNLNIDLASLWKAVCQEEETRLYMENISANHSAVLAEFRYWAYQEFGSCLAVWPRLLAAAAPAAEKDHWRSDTSLKVAAFTRALKSAGWPGTSDPRSCAALSAALDVSGCGIVSRQDLRWLDSWVPPKWLRMPPDREAWEELSGLIVRAHSRPLRAWQSLDRDDSNAVTYTEFEDECERVGFTGNIGGAWRYLDQDVSGTITLDEFDGPSAKLLLSFKNFVDSHFGSVEFAFKSMDTDGSGDLTFSELRRGCQQLQWSGDVRELFDCVGAEIAPGKRTLSYRHVAFLDSWLPKIKDRDGEAELEAEGGGATSSSSSRHRRLPAGPPPPATVSSLGHSESCPGFRNTSSSAISLPSVQKADGGKKGTLRHPCRRVSSRPSRAKLVDSMRAANDCLRERSARLREEHAQVLAEAQAFNMTWH